MKLFTLDWGWSGCHVVVAESREQALDRIAAYDSSQSRADLDKYLTEHPLTSGMHLLTGGSERMGETERL
jgi:hypothetical protein